MELPKNVTQIGESDRYCKIYAEDYVISYIKQLNRHAESKELAVALYGTRKEENGISYLFFYGAAKLDFLQRECRHLSQAQLQEIEKLRRKHFPETVFLGYRILDGEMVEGFHVYEQDTCRYIKGYAQFYEKNDSMLAFMLEERQGEIQPEEVDQGKYEAVKKRQEQRRNQNAASKGVGTRKEQERPLRPEGGVRRAGLTAAAVFALLCAAGLATMGGNDKLGELQEAARQVADEISQKQLPDALPVAANPALVGTIVAEDKLTDAIRKENGQTPQSTPEPVATPQSTPEPAATPQPTPEPAAAPQSTPEPAATPQPTPEPAATPQPTPEPVATPQPTPEPVTYTIRRGDTLIGICLKRYGSDTRVSEICQLNAIEDADDIKIGQKIQLP